MVREPFGRISTKFCAIALLATCALIAQQPAPLAFEVATIKPAPPLNPASGKLHVGMNIEAGRVDIGFMSIADLIRTAYEVKPYQVSGPDWINTERFDILAKIPEGGTKEQVPAMLKTLLQERFKLAVHKESKEHAVYALVAGKGGSKLKESPPDEPATPEAAAAPSGKGGTVIETNSGSMRVKPNADGKGATITTGAMGTMKMGMSPDGTMHMEASKVSMPQFAEIVSRFVDKPVVDETGLKGNYQIALDLSMADLMRVAQKAGIGMPMAGAGPGGAAAGVADAASDPGGGGTVFTAVQSLGLKLEPKKEAVDTYIVDHAEKTPSEN
ncbi:MAG TPA: TIGR03435 family protein [Bryobacteraceae bacterium]|nr:TIGR03435 family protein [Bryobacteraceae bacterium]